MLHWGYAEMTYPNPNPKICCKCHKVCRSNFSFLGCDMLGWGYAENPPPQPKKLSQPENQNVIESEIEIHKFFFQASNKVMEGWG